MIKTKHLQNQSHHQKHRFSIYDTSTEGSAVKLKMRRMTLRMFDCAKCDTALEVCGIQTVDKVLDQLLTNSEKEPEEEEVIKHEAAFLNAL
jgi:hypothetical protein